MRSWSLRYAFWILLAPVGKPQGTCCLRGTWTELEGVQHPSGPSSSYLSTAAVFHTLAKDVFEIEFCLLRLLLRILMCYISIYSLCLFLYCICLNLILFDSHFISFDSFVYLSIHSFYFFSALPLLAGISLLIVSDITDEFFARSSATGEQPQTRRR